MKNLVFRFYLTVILCWQSGVAERSANGYFYDKPEGTLFDESPSTDQVSNSAPIFPPQQPAVPTGGYFQQLLTPIRAQTAPQAIDTQTVEVVPAQLVYEETHPINANIGFQQQNLQTIPNTPDFQQSQEIYRGSGGANLQPITFTAQDATQAYGNVQQPCGPEPIIAQYNPELVDLSNGGPLTRIITTCGPNNDCSTINLQSDLNRQLGVLQSQPKTSYDADVQQAYPALQEAQPRSGNIDIFTAETPLVRPPGRRLIQYNEEERVDRYN